MERTKERVNLLLIFRKKTKNSKLNWRKKHPVKSHRSKKTSGLTKTKSLRCWLPRSSKWIWLSLIQSNKNSSKRNDLYCRCEILRNCWNQYLSLFLSSNKYPGSCFYMKPGKLVIEVAYCILKSLSDSVGIFVWDQLIDKRGNKNS